LGANAGRLDITGQFIWLLPAEQRQRQRHIQLKFHNMDLKLWCLAEMSTSSDHDHESHSRKFEQDECLELHCKCKAMQPLGRKRFKPNPALASFSLYTHVLQPANEPMICMNVLKV